MDKSKVLLSTVNSRHLIDYYLIEELLNGLPRGYATRVQSKISKHNIEYCHKKTIYVRAKAILTGEKTLTPAADMDGIPTLREGKDRCYEGLWTLIDILIPNKDERRYVGLAANQIGVVRDRIQPREPLVVCERNRERAKDFRRLASFLMKDKEKANIEVINRNIFSHLKSSKASNQYNIFDIDLMSAMPKENKIDRWALSLVNASRQGINIVYLATCVGRGISIAEHKERMQYFHKALENVGLTLVSFSSFGYRDRVIPIRGERIVFEKIGGNNE